MRSLAHCSAPSWRRASGVQGPRAPVCGPVTAKVVAGGRRIPVRTARSKGGLLSIARAAPEAAEPSLAPVAIDPERIARVEAELEATEGEENAFVDDTPSFADLGVDRLFMPGLDAASIKLPSPIQEAAIPRILQGGNCAVQSYTGSGKTLAYLLPALTLAFRRAEAIYEQRRGRGGNSGGNEGGWTVQVLIVAPSQELAMQIVRTARSLLPEGARPAVQQLIGGANPFRQREALIEHRPIVVVGTPGRLAEMVRSGALLLHRCPMLILDEADQLLAANFSEDMAHIAAHAGKRVERQTVLVSATLSASVLRRFDRWCPAPDLITPVGASAPAVPESGAFGDGSAAAAAAAGQAPAWGWGVKGWDGPASEVAPRGHGTAGGAEGDEGLVPTMPPALRHLYVIADPRHRVDALRRCVHALGAGRALVFMNWQQRLRDAQHKLEARSMPVASLHGEMGKQARQSTLESFAKGDQRILLVSDVAARGLDVPGIDAVFNLELPSNAAHYAHRAGRTGRMGASGVVVSVAAPGERFVVERLAARLGVPIEEAHVVGGEFIIGPPPPPTKPKKRKPAATDATAAETTGADAPDATKSSGGTAQAAATQKGKQGQQQQQKEQKGKEQQKKKSQQEEEEDYEEIFEDEEDEEEGSDVIAARAAAAKTKLSKKALAEVEAFLQRERETAASGGGVAGGGRGAAGRGRGGGAGRGGRGARGGSGGAGRGGRRAARAGA